MGNVLIPMAGLGSRFSLKGYKEPKPLIDVCGKPMIQHAIETLGFNNWQFIFVIRKYENLKYNDQLKELLESITTNPIIHEIDFDTEGATHTCLQVKDLIDNDDELIITNCDQILNWKPNTFLFGMRMRGVDGGILTYTSTDLKNSFAKCTIDRLVIQIAEKKAISDIALVGLHYWKKGSDFVWSAEKLMEHEDKTKNEYYIAPTYNELIKTGKNIYTYHINKDDYISLGSPEELKEYVGKHNEYNIDKPKTIICDLDGTILKHQHSYSDVARNKPELVDGVREKFDEWDSKGHKIIIMTGRKECAREITERDLTRLGICWDQLVMNVGNGPRIIINDKLEDKSLDRAISVNIVVDSGFQDVDWRKIGL